ncbi:hypothetical protein GIB67_026712, partial [Kingdonia uniflora]
MNKCGLHRRTCRNIRSTKTLLIRYCKGVWRSTLTQALNFTTSSIVLSRLNFKIEVKLVHCNWGFWISRVLGDWN